MNNLTGINLLKSELTLVDEALNSNRLSTYIEKATRWVDCFRCYLRLTYDLKLNNSKPPKEYIRLSQNFEVPGESKKAIFKSLGLSNYGYCQPYIISTSLLEEGMTILTADEKWSDFIKTKVTDVDKENRVFVTDSGLARRIVAGECAIVLHTVCKEDFILEELQ